MTMERCRLLLLPPWLTVICAIYVMENTAELMIIEPVIKNVTNNNLQVIPYNEDNSSVTTLVMEGNLITLNEEDRLALASYPALKELHLDGNMITGIPAEYFSVVPHLRVLALSRNNISSLDPEAFVGLHFLTELDLSHNLLTSLPAQLIRGLKELQMLILQENPWNCSCPLLNTFKEMNAVQVSSGGPQVICASPANQAGSSLLDATALCFPSPIPTVNPTAPAQTQQPQSSTAMLMTTLPTSQNHSSSKVQVPTLGNTWKFTACVVALALTTSILILCAIKGPSWYKLFHNYRHRRLQEDEDDTVSTGRHMSHHTFTFKQHKGQVEEVEEEDGYTEDPYIEREDWHVERR